MDQAEGLGKGLGLIMWPKMTCVLREWINGERERLFTTGIDGVDVLLAEKFSQESYNSRRLRNREQ